MKIKSANSVTIVLLFSSRHLRHTSRHSITFRIFFLWRNSTMRARAASIFMFIDHTQWHTTVGRTLWTRDRPAAETFTWQHTPLTTDKCPSLPQSSKPQSQHESGCRPSHLTTRPLGSAMFRTPMHNNHGFFSSQDVSPLAEFCLTHSVSQARNKSVTFLYPFSDPFVYWLVCLIPTISFSNLFNSSFSFLLVFLTIFIRVVITSAIY